ncbi:MAG: nuclear transport factor 2 family protein, partial [Gaiellaceae bacterium]
MSTSDDAKLKALGEVLGAFNRHDLDAIMSYFADDCVFDSPRGPDVWGRRFVGKEEVARGLAA